MPQASTTALRGMQRLAGCIPLVLLAMACVPPPIAPPHPSEITVTRARVENLVGRQVRWGGEVASVTPTERETCFEVIDRPLAQNGQPIHTEQTAGRFLACTPQFYPRGLYEGQDVTVAGTLETPAPGQLDSLDHRYPRVAIAALNFWPQPQSSHGDRYGSRWWQPSGQGSQGYWW